jgi:NAD(P)-dependent dehydrogenase (short-subunit alcohol dehydrogenase family)
MIKNKVILVTGGAGRIGLSLVKSIVKKGNKVAVIDTDKKKIRSLEVELGKKNFLGMVSDLNNSQEVDIFINKINVYFGKIDASVHAAYPRSDGWGTKFENLKKDFLYEDLTKQLGGAILFSQRIINFFNKQGFGNLIHISSVLGISTPKFEHYKNTNMVSPVEYSAIKAGLIAVTKYLSKYYKNKKIRVNCVSPGGILDNQPKTFINNYRKVCNEKGLLHPEDVVRTILFLLSDESRHINGQNIVIDDGWSL